MTWLLSDRTIESKRVKRMNTIITKDGTQIYFKDSGIRPTRRKKLPAECVISSIGHELSHIKFNDYKSRFVAGWLVFVLSRLAVQVGIERLCGV